MPQPIQSPSKQSESNSFWHWTLQNRSFYALFHFSLLVLSYWIFLHPWWVYVLNNKDNNVTYEIETEILLQDTQRAYGVSATRARIFKLSCVLEYTLMAESVLTIFQPNWVLVYVKTYRAQQWILQRAEYIAFNRFLGRITSTRIRGHIYQSRLADHLVVWQIYNLHKS
jgi:hypothetical protein